MKDSDFIFLLNRLVVYSLSTAMSSVTGSHTMDLFYLLEENFKNLPFDSLITENEHRQVVLFIKLFVATKLEILKNTLEHITRH